MSRQLELVQEERTKKTHKALVRAVEFELQSAVALTGGVLTGFSVKIDEWQTLITLKAIVDDVPSVSFVGADSLTGCFLKAVREARSDKLAWREDKWRQVGG